MKILLTGATGYIGKRLLHRLLEQGHEVFCCVRDANRFDGSLYKGKPIRILEVDFLKVETLHNIPKGIDAAYYLIHSMSSSLHDFKSMEQNAAKNFKKQLEKTRCKQIIYLSGISNDKSLSEHLDSRRCVEEALASDHFALTVLRAGIIVGSGSASFEIIRDLVEKLPLMITPRWLKTKSQPISIRNVLDFLTGVLFHESSFNKTLDIGGPDVLTYKEMLLQFAEARGLKRWIYTVPVMTPKLSSYWLYFVTSTSYKLAVNLVDSMKVEVICRPNSLARQLGIRLISYKEALQMALKKIDSHQIESSWIDAQSSEVLEGGVDHLLQIPEYGCFRDIRTAHVEDLNYTRKMIWQIGGENGWYYADWLWDIRGFIDKLVGGVGLQRGRRNPDDINVGESLDFWRVVVANSKEVHLLLYAEMKLPGEAWLEFKLENGILKQTATFRPLGLWGRLYWYLVLPFHAFIFQGMINKVTKLKST